MPQVYILDREKGINAFAAGYSPNDAVVAVTRGCLTTLSRAELQGVIALTAEQVIRGPERRPTLAELIDEGALVVAGGETVNRQARLYPIGTAMALAHVLRHAKDA